MRANPTVRTGMRETAAGLFCAVAALVLVSWPTLRWMTERFDASDSFYSHGWLVPLASAWLMWQRREVIKACTLQPSFWGLAFLVPSLLVHAVATVWHLGFLGGLAMLGTLYGLVWTWWGGRAFWVLRFPLAFLLFMVPLPGVLLIATSFHMKLMAAGLATHVIQLIGISAHQAGSMIQVPGMNVIVDDTCSGLRSLISLIALSTLWTSLLPGSAKTWQKLMVVAASIPIAITGNMVRIVFLVLLSAVYGPKVAASFIHYGSGIVVFGIVLVALAWVSHLVQQWPRPSNDLE